MYQHCLNCLYNINHCLFEAKIKKVFSIKPRKKSSYLCMKKSIFVSTWIIYYLNYQILAYIMYNFQFFSIVIYYIMKKLYILVAICTHRDSMEKLKNFFSVFHYCRLKFSSYNARNLKKNSRHAKKEFL